MANNGKKTVHHIPGEKKGVSLKQNESPALTEKPIRYEDQNFVDSSKPVWNYSILYDDDIETFKNGTHYTLYKKFGSRPLTVLSKEGFYFAVWAPNATQVCVTGNFNDWHKDSHVLFPRLDKSGIWEGFIPGILKGELYKYRITGYKNIVTEKGDPFASYWEKRPLTSSITWEFDYAWKDAAWMKRRKRI
jgi:1,4-alpha-glucan branching enzyme